MATASSRFSSRSEEEIAVLRTDLNSKSTLKANKRAASTFRAYLSEKNQPTDFENFDKVKLNETLAHFYINLRKTDGKKYKVNNLENIRHSINRYLQATPHYKRFDVVKDDDFRDANVNFRAVLAELKREGKGAVDHHPVISDSDLGKIYGNFIIDTPTGLFNKVQMDIRLYFFRRGSENMHEMTIDTFCGNTDPDTGRRYVGKQVDELTKNHREFDKENIGGFMPEMPGDLICPVSSYIKYTSRLNKDCNRLWQRPKDSFTDDDDVWYYNIPVGKKTLAGFMKGLSKTLKPSKSYSNHSVRATGATLLSRSQFGAAQIMSVTGHKSVSSLAVYRRVSDKEKLAMGNTIATHVDATSSGAQMALPAPPVRLAIQGPVATCQPSSSGVLAMALLPPPAPEAQGDCRDLYDAVMDVTEDESQALQPFLQDILCDYNEVLSSQQTLTQSKTLSKTSGMFNGCKIENLTINFNISKS